MNKKTIFTSVFALVSLLVISSCGSNSNTPVDPPHKEVEATTIKQTYKMYGQHSYFKTNYFPNKGTANVLVLPIWFTDSDNIIINDEYKDNIVEDTHTAFFGSEDDIGWHSMKTFYEEESNHTLFIDGYVADWYEAPYSMDEVGHSESLVRETVSLATDSFFNKNPLFPRTLFDADKDGSLDAVMCIYAAPDYYQQGYNDYREFWAYATSTGSITGTKEHPTLNMFFWCSFDFLYGEETTYDRTGTYFYAGDTTAVRLDTKTIIHETGHLFGLPDYYDYGRNNFNPAGCFSMQDYAVGSHDPYSMMANGWVKPFIIKEEGQYVLSSFQETRQVILLTPEWNKYDSSFDEYLLLELFSPTGLNEFDCNHVYRRMGIIGPKTTGIRLWHVDARLYNFSTSKLTQNASTGKLYPAFSNSSDPEQSILGPAFADYNILQLIKKSVSAGLRPRGQLQPQDLFIEGSSFSMDTHSLQFPNGNQLNSYLDLGWKFTVKEIASDENGVAQAVINIYKTN